MNDSESISEMFTRFTRIVNSLKAFGSDMPNVELVNKILHSLTKSGEPNVTTILEAKDLIVLKLKQLIGSLTTHTMITFTDEKNKKKDFALKVSTSNGDDDEAKEVSLLLRKFKWFLIRRITKASKNDSNDVMKCYKCRMLG